MNSKCSTTWSKSNEFQTYDGAKVKVFARFESECARRRHLWLLVFPARSDAARRNFYRPVDHVHDWRKKQRWGRWRYFFFFYRRGSFKCMIVILPTFWHSAPAWDFSWQLTRNVSLATMLVHSYRRSLLAMARRAFTVSWNVEVFVHSRSVVISPPPPPPPQAPPSLVSSPSKYPPSFVALAFNKTKPAELSPRSPS